MNVLSLLFIQIFAGYIILRHFASSHFPFAAVASFFDSRHHSGLKRVAFLDQLVNAFGVGTFNVR